MLFGLTTSGRSNSESCPSPRRGTVTDFGVDGSDDNNMLVVCFGWGSKNLIRGLVNKPNTTVLKRTTVMVLVIMIAFARN